MRSIVRTASFALIVAAAGCSARGLAIVDGYNGEVIINPSEKTKKQVRDRIQKYTSFEEKLNSLKTLPATTRLRLTAR